eukprot:UN28796
MERYSQTRGDDFTIDQRFIFNEYPIVGHTLYVGCRIFSIRTDNLWNTKLKPPQIKFVHSSNLDKPKPPILKILKITEQTCVVQWSWSKINDELWTEFELRIKNLSNNSTQLRKLRKTNSSTKECMQSFQITNIKPSTYDI